MGVVNYISDPHFGHRNIALSRGFESSEEHDEFLIEQWNSKINKRDTVWILGDITMEKSDYSILDRLKGNKKVVLGNHDKPQHLRNLLEYCNHVCGMYQHTHENRRIIMSHAPIHPNSLIEKLGSLNMHGHSHKFEMNDPKYMNVCPEIIGYKPLTIQELFDFFKIPKYEYKTNGGTEDN